MVEAAERMRPVPPARDVASLMASLDHVGRVVLHRTEGLDAEARDRVNVWIERAQAMILEAYRATLKAAGRLDLLDESLLLPFQVQQECREYAYADRYLPHWRYVPDAALPALLNRGPR
jgi:maltokinase